MKFLSFLTILLLCLISCNQKQVKYKTNDVSITFQSFDSTDLNNNFYDNTETFGLPLEEITIDGEIENPGKVNFSELKKHSVIVKEALLDDNGNNKFTGAFRYDGYSLFDIIENSIVKKSNADEFSSVIDLFVEIENIDGEKVVFSWGEIFYPKDLHKILIATNAARIVPSKTKDLWVLPERSRIVAAGDLITERNISNPRKITVRSFPGSFKTIKGPSPMFSGKVDLYNGAVKTAEITALTANINSITYNTIFYSRGGGIHSTSPFAGIMLKEVLGKYFPVNRDNLMKGIFCISGKDGYRCTVSFSELFNRNDQQEFLLMECNEGDDGGLFRMFAAPDFFSDRAIKSVSEIDLGF
jgi:hypothetical protein